MQTTIMHQLIPPEFSKVRRSLLAGLKWHIQEKNIFYILQSSTHFGVCVDQRQSTQQRTRDPCGALWCTGGYRIWHDPLGGCFMPCCLVIFLRIYFLCFVPLLQANSQQVYPAYRERSGPRQLPSDQRQQLLAASFQQQTKTHGSVSANFDLFL